MKYLIAIVFPPLAVLLCGKPFQFILNLLLCCFVIPAVIHALLVVSSYEADQRTNRIVAAMQRPRTFRVQRSERS